MLDIQETKRSFFKSGYIQNITTCVLCYRATEAAKFGYYDLIEDMFSKSTNDTLDSINRYGATNVTVEDLYVKLRHNKEDFIVKYINTFYFLTLFFHYRFIIS